jgi:RimJ/RimL family protein N-acetyltransferase
MREAMPFPAHLLPQQTERLTLRRFTEADLDRFLAYRHDPVVARFQSWSMLSEDEAIAFIHEMSTAPIGIPGEWFHWFYSSLCLIGFAVPRPFNDEAIRKLRNQLS